MPKLGWESTITTFHLTYNGSLAEMKLIAPTEGNQRSRTAEGTEDKETPLPSCQEVYGMVWMG